MKNSTISAMACAAAALLWTAHSHAVPTFSVLNSYAYPQLNAGSSSALTFDGTNLLFLTQKGGGEDVFFLDPLTGVVQRQITPSNSFTIGSMTWDGSDIRAANVTTGAGTVRRIDPITGLEGATIPGPAPASRNEGMAFDGVSLFLAYSGINLIFEIDPTTGAVANSFPTAQSLFGLTFGGGNTLFGASPDTNEILGIDKTTGANLFSFAAPGSGNPHGLAYDGTNLYVADQASNTIFVLAPAVAEPASLALFGLGLAGLGLRRRKRIGNPMPWEGADATDSARAASNLRRSTAMHAA